MESVRGLLWGRGPPEDTTLADTARAKEELYDRIGKTNRTIRKLANEERSIQRELAPLLERRALAIRSNSKAALVEIGNKCRPLMARIQTIERELAKANAKKAALTKALDETSAAADAADDINALKSATAQTGKLLKKVSHHDVVDTMQELGEHHQTLDRIDDVWLNSPSARAWTPSEKDLDAQMDAMLLAMQEQKGLDDPIGEDPLAGLPPVPVTVPVTSQTTPNGTKDNENTNIL